MTTTLGIVDDSKGLVDLANSMRLRYGEDVAESVVNGINDAAFEPSDVAQYFSAINFKPPMSARKRKKRRKDYPVLMIIDRERVKPAILERLKAANIEESVKKQIAANAYDAVMKAVIKEVPRHEFAPYVHDKSRLDKICADICALGGRCGGCGAQEVACVCRDAATGEPLGLLCPRCLGAIKDAPADPGKVWEVVYPPVKADD
jgi:hypothetical protein